jgi:hypothetical protein
MVRHTSFGLLVWVEAASCYPVRNPSPCEFLLLSLGPWLVAGRAHLETNTDCAWGRGGVRVGVPVWGCPHDTNKQYLVSEQSPRPRDRAVAASVCKWLDATGDKSSLSNPSHLLSDANLAAAQEGIIALRITYWPAVHAPRWMHFIQTCYRWIWLANSNCNCAWLTQ